MNTLLSPDRMSPEAILTYEDACRYLDDLQMHKIKLGLEAMASILVKLGSPERQCPALHVAGTNGKGSVCSMLRSILSAAGYKTGLYTSPHLSSVRERFRIDDDFIDKEDFTRLMERVRQALGGRTITYFECVTALAFCWFAERNCDVVILETGMGGRLDATNVVTPLVSVITTVSLDHEQYLGETIEAIAFEKSGIIKPQVPVVSGVLAHGAREVIELTCRQREASLAVRNADFTMMPAADGTWSWRNRQKTVEIDQLPTRKSGAWQIDNTACAVAAVMSLRQAGYLISDTAVRKGLRLASWPGRMEYLEIDKAASAAACSETIRFLLDGAHNPAGVELLVESVKNDFSFTRLYLVWASMGDKKYETMLRGMAIGADCLLLTRLESERAALPEDLARTLEGYYDRDMICCQDVASAHAEVMKLAGPEDLVVVAGSLYLIGEFRKLLVGEVVEGE